MAYATRRAGGGGWTSVRPYTTYGNVIANYGAALQQAQETASNVELQTKILEYKNGTASYQDVVNLLKTKQTGAIPGSQRELDLKEVGLQLEQYETTKNREIKRADLKTKYAKGGISAEEQLQIEKEMLANYKEGTAEYSEQLSSIATATELANQERKNEKMAQIQAALSSGGITVNEEIQLYEEGKSMADRGSEEYSLFEQKINEAKVRKEEQDIAVRASERYSEMLEQYKDGGLTNEEKLKINTELLKIYKPGSEDYIKAQENEAELLGGIANERRAAGRDAADLEKEKAKIEFNYRQERIARIDKDIAEGVNPVGLLNEKMRLYGEQQDYVNQYGADIAGNIAEWQVDIEDTTNLRNMINSGQAVVVSLGQSGGKQMTEIVPIDKLQTMGFEKFVQDEKNPKQLTSRKVITIIDRDGQTKDVVVTPDGGLQEVTRQEYKVGRETKEKYVLGALTGYGSKATQTIRPPSTPEGSVLGTATAALQTPATPGVTYTPPKPKSGSKSSTSKPKAQSTVGMTQTPAIAGITYTAPKTGSTSTKNQSPLQLQSKLPTTNQQKTTSTTQKNTNVFSNIVSSVKRLFGF